MTDQLTEAIERAAEYGGGPERIWQVPESATIQLADGTGHLLTDAVITHWSVD